MSKFLSIVILLLLSNNLLGQEKANTPLPAFESVPASYSGLDFQNMVKANIATKENLFDYDFFYNGSGVAVGDFNNDGLPDLFFTANQEQNRIYLNQGNLQFKDITQSANVNTGKNWSSGVSLADVNADGWLDIYISQGGPFEKEKRKNLLFINQRNNTFSEQAEVYGLADSGISTQTAFFDYDQDGDLDCIVANENTLYGVDPVNFYRILEERPQLLWESSSHLYRNDNGKFLDVTQKAGMLSPTFGLGLSLSDINNDGWVDVYIANDYYVPDAMYINQKNGTFRNEIKQRTNQISFYGMGVDIADINNDGRQDIYVLDMASADHFRSKTLMASMNVSNFRLLVEDLDMPHQYMFNSLQLNRGNDYFDNVAHLSKVSKTDWSWAGLIADFNHDGLKDIFVSNGYRRYALDNDLKNRVLEAQIKYEGKVPVEVKEELYYSMPTERLANIFYLNQGDLKFENVAKKVGLETPSFSNGAAFADLDLDGDLDIVVNNIDMDAFLYRNLASDRKMGNYLRVKLKAPLSESFAKIKIYYGDQQQMFESKRIRGYLSSVDNIAHFGLGDVKKIDSLIVLWPGGAKTIKRKLKVNRTIEIDLTESKSNEREVYSLPKQFSEVSVGKLKLFYKHQENAYDDFEKEVLLPYKQSSLGPCIVKGDINGDGLEDLYIGGAMDQSGAFFVQTDKAFVRQIPPAILEDSLYEDQCAVFLDYDQDGDQDLLVGSGGNSTPAEALLYQNRLYRNDGGGTWTDRSKDLGSHSNANTGDVSVLDFDKDGDMDILIGNRIEPQAYPRSAASQLLENKGGFFEEVTSTKIPDLLDFGIVNQVLVTDFNQDGWQDIIAVGEWTGIACFENQQGVFYKIEQPGLSDRQGWWFSVTETDANKDGLPDYIIGNLGLNSKYSASSEHPLKLYANDFDQSGTLDIVLSKDYQGKEVPLRGRECSSQQMPFIKEKFPTFKEFAEASLDDIYGEEIEESFVLKATDFHSVLLLNQGNGMFKVTNLPRIAQMFPLLTTQSLDLNADGFDDLILSGTIFETEVETPRWDAGSGLVLYADRNGGYQVSKNTQKHLNIKGDIKSSILIQHQGLDATFLIYGINNALPKVLRVQK